MILLVNDDGFRAPGLAALALRVWEALHQPVLVVAPRDQRSGAGGSITLDRALCVEAQREGQLHGFSVDGTPADCVKIALTSLVPEIPALTISGINDGPNVGRSLSYSGTVGAAMEAAIAGQTALAVSHARGEPADLEAIAALSTRVATLALRRSSALRGCVLNLNTPAGPAQAWKPLRACKAGLGGFVEGYQAIRDAQGRLCWQLRGSFHPGQEGDDASLLAAGHPTLSILRPRWGEADVRLSQRLVEALELP